MEPSDSIRINTEKTVYESEHISNLQLQIAQQTIDETLFSLSLNLQ